MSLQPVPAIRAGCKVPLATCTIKRAAETQFTWPLDVLAVQCTRCQRQATAAITQVAVIASVMQHHTLWRALCSALCLLSARACFPCLHSRAVCTHNTRARVPAHCCSPLCAACMVQAACTAERHCRDRHVSGWPAVWNGHLHDLHSVTSLQAESLACRPHTTQQRAKHQQVVHNDLVVHRKQDVRHVCTTQTITPQLNCITVNKACRACRL